MTDARLTFQASGWAFLLLAAAAVPAFWPLYLARPAADVDPYTHAHAAVMAAWCVLLVTQPFLARRARAWHRAGGVASYVLAPAVLLSALLLAHQRFAAMDAATLDREGANLYLPLSAIVLFAPAYGGGVLWRRERAVHARFLVTTAFPLIDPVVGRLMAFYLPPLPGYLWYQVITFGAGDLVLAWLAWRDRHSPSGWVFRVMLAWTLLVHAGWFTLAGGDQWLAAARWFARLPLT